MKKFIWVLVALAAVIVVGCDKNEGSDETSLVGTIWQGESLRGEVFRLQFVSASRVKTTEVEDGRSWSHNLRYEFIPPYLFIYDEDDYEGVYVAFSGIRDDNTMDIYDGDYIEANRYWLTVYKQ